MRTNLRVPQRGVLGLETSPLTRTPFVVLLARLKIPSPLLVHSTSTLKLSTSKVQPDTG